ncbi:1-acyl-sn-glycerol-3-phosphate acyltransferase [Metamycoplasma cloacale]|uniref:1-acyl-sn-glycerol-3-phosphate acyltransferase n=1 Tax=Metamycoplasma cloacale TaxID=92401 RepID=A0A2Z4LLS2_9BACT|nr:lysophospholipid acyltransferase family protein [Metamycoplasma cloacale]AWX42640.1 1-acyl-sn-glycerol-3-phosphate acyltransferase [Metamycoplasma cloacale]VEU79580.1 1-acyl-sn-glycerol-3-phosphate acyltransferase [Metamycoplasma cloacale]
MKLKTRMFWNILPILSLYWNIQLKARKNKRMPEYISKVERNEFLQKRFKSILKYLGIKVNVKGLENVPDGACLIVPNHSTYLDALIMTVAMNNNGNVDIKNKISSYIANSSVQDKKGIALVASLMDTFYLDMEKPREVVKNLYDFGNFVKSTKSCGVIFAEGTRTKDGKLGEFKPGAFKIAQDCFLPIVPVTINNAANALDKNREGILEVEVIFHNAIKPAMVNTVKTSDIAEIVKNTVASAYIEQTITSDETIKNTYTKRAHKK